MKRTGWVLFFVVVMVSVHSFAGNVGINGGGPAYTSIQDAVNAAGSGDSLQISTGTFFEAVTIAGKDLVLRGGYNNNLDTFVGGYSAIDGTNANTVVQLNSTTTDVSDLWIINGDGWGSSGGGVALNNARALFENVNIQSNRQLNGGGFYVGTGSYLELTNCVVATNYALWGGGGFVWGTFKAGGNSTLINGNQAESGGGGLYFYNNAVGVLSEADITYNIATNHVSYGGGIGVNNAQLDILHGVLIAGNRGGFGGGIFAEGADVNLSDSGIAQINYNEAGHGGGIYATNSAVRSGYNMFFGNRAGGMGGGLCLYSSSLTTPTNRALTLEILSNKAEWNGGGIDMTLSTALVYNVVIGSNANRNACRDLGAGLHATSSVLEIHGAYLGLNVCTNDSWGWGGGMALQDCAIHMTNTAEMSYNQFFANDAGYDRGRGGNLYLEACRGNAELHRLSLFAGQAGLGGGVYATATTIRATYWDVNSNEAFQEGGGVLLRGGVDHVFDYVWFQGNTAKTNGGGLLVDSANRVYFWFNAPYYSNSFQNLVIRNKCGGQGGGLYLYDTDLKLHATRIFTNQANEGGGICMVGGINISSVTLSNGCMNGNVATNHGGGMCLYDTHADIIDFDWLNNYTVQGDGGAIYSAGWGTARVYAVYRGCAFSENTAMRNGGAMYFNSVGSLWLTGLSTNRLKFENCFASGDGGGVYAHASAVSVSGDVQFISNDAVTNGGGMALMDTPRCVFTSSEEAFPYFYFNWGRQHGGGLYQQSSTTVVQHAWFLDNTASLDGGGLYARGGGLNVQLAKFKNNTCSNNGGGLYLEGMHTVAIDQVSAPWPSVMEDPWPLSITENECENGYGGGLFITNCPAVWMNRLSIYSNRAMAAAGAYIDTSMFESRNALFARNDPDVYAAAGALMLVNSTCAVFQTTIVDNEETAIAMDSNTTLALEESIVWNHQTQIWGGGSPGTAQVYYCCIQDPSYSPVFNTTSNPCLYPNYHLRYNSPCIDLGALAMGYDFDHETRIFQNDAGFDEFVDMDLDRLPNIVETATGTWVDEMNTGTSWIDADWDDDGYNDGMEWLAGTDPFDSASYLGFVNVLPVGTNCHLTWQGGTGRDQYIMVATNVPNPVWRTIYTNVAPADITNSAVLGAAGNPAIFAVGVRDPVP